MKVVPFFHLMDILGCFFDAQALHIGDTCTFHGSFAYLCDVFLLSFLDDHPHVNFSFYFFFAIPFSRSHVLQMKIGKLRIFFWGMIVSLHAIAPLKTLPFICKRFPLYGKRVRCLLCHACGAVSLIAAHQTIIDLLPYLFHM